MTDMTAGQIETLEKANKLAAWDTRALKNGAIFVLVLNVLDLLTTYIAIAHFGASELNPVAQFLIDTWLLVPAKIIAVGAIMYSAWNTKPTPMNVAGVWWIAGIYSLTIVLNTVHIFMA